MNEIEMQYDKLQTKIAMAKGRSCDKYDYMIAVFSGLTAGIVDSLFVGKPNRNCVDNSVLGKWSDQQSERVLGKIADTKIQKDYDLFEKLKKSGFSGAELQEEMKKRGIPQNLSKKGYNTLSEKITYLENKYPVCYDNSVAPGTDLGLSPNNHHIRSLSHSPDILGLCCAIIDQFQHTTTIFNDGRLITIVPQKSGLELRGTTLISKLFCAFCNWIGHLLSDFCGSHSSRGRGTGISIPFFEMFQVCDFGNFTVDTCQGTQDMTLAELSVKVFEQGYDARFGIAMSIPVILESLLIKFLWALKRHFYHHKTWQECIPSEKHPDLRVMLIVGNATLCFIDGTDAAIRSKGNILEFALHLNIIAWFTLTVRVFKEIMIRFDFTYEDLRIQFEFLNYQLEEYIARLKSIDYVQYERDLADLDEINVLLLDDKIDLASERMSSYITEKNIDTDFDDFDAFLKKMSDPESVIKF